MRLTIIIFFWTASVTLATQSSTAGLTNTDLSIAPAGNYSVLSQDVFDSWKEYAHYSGAAYCPQSLLRQWKCHHCQFIQPPPKVIAMGGNNAQMPRWFVANNGTHTILSISGTNSIPMWFYNLAWVVLRPIDGRDFPGAPPMKLHLGWYKLFLLMQPTVTAAVKESIATTPELLIVGHSLGAVEGLIFATYFKANYPSWSITTRLFALPRIGDQAWADFVDLMNGDRQQHMTNYNDPITALPFHMRGWRHPSGELWIDSIKGDRVRIGVGQEDPNGQNSMHLGELIQEGIVNMNFFPRAHIGPYNRVKLNPFLCYPGLVMQHDMGADVQAVVSVD